MALELQEDGDIDLIKRFVDNDVDVNKKGEGKAPLECGSRERKS